MPWSARKRIFSEDDLRWSGWMRAAQMGDKIQYEQLLGEVATAVQHYLRARFGPADFVDDITQECLLSIHAGRHSYDVDRPFRAWMFSIVRHRTIDFLRRQRGPWARDSQTLDIESLRSPPPDSDIADASTLLGQLSSEHREVIVLVKYLGLSAAETGKELGLSTSAVRVRLHRALKLTQRALKSDLAEASL